MTRDSEFEVMAVVEIQIDQGFGHHVGRTWPAGVCDEPGGVWASSRHWTPAAIRAAGS